jgi:hypothetical protein
MKVDLYMDLLHVAVHLSFIQILLGEEKEQTWCQYLELN